MAEEMEIPRDWTFKNHEVAKHFERHVREQLPFYDLVTGCLTHIIRHYLPENGLIYDIGCSNGNLGRSIASILINRNAKLIAIDGSQEMAERYTGPGKFVLGNAEEYEFEKFDVSVLFLTLMFIPVSKRKDLIERLTSLIKPGGALIVFDKVEPDAGFFGTVSYRMTLAGKIAAGATANAVIQKELSLSGIQRPINGKLLTGAKTWFQMGEFKGWIIEAPNS